MAKAKFTQSEVTRAVKGCTDAGMSVSGVEIDHNGKICVKFGYLKTVTNSNTEGWDKKIASYPS